MKKEHVAFIIKSGKEKKKIIHQWMAKTKELFEVSSHITQHAGHAEDLTVAAIDYGAQKIVAVGGDGTLHEVINGIVASQNPKTPVLFLPAGTANDWGKTHSPPENDDEFIKRLQSRGNAIDLGKIKWRENNFQYFINVADTGMGAPVIREVERITWRISADIKFFLAILKVFVNFRNAMVECFIDGNKVYHGPARTLVIANGRYFGSGLCIAPGANPSDGNFEVVIIGNVSLLAYLKYVPSLRAGRYIRHPKVHYHNGKKILIETPDFLTEADGEYIGAGTMAFEFADEAIFML